MRQATHHVRRTRSGRLAPLLAFAALLGVCVTVAMPVAAGAEAGGRLVAEPVVSAAAAGVRQLFGASPLEAPGEVWGVGEAPRSRSHIVRYTETGGWEAVGDPLESSGQPVELSSQGIPRTATAGRTTPAGGVVAVAALDRSERPAEVLIVRDPGGLLRAIPAPAEPIPPETEPPLRAEEQLFLSGSNPNVRVAAVEEEGGKTGAFVVPYANPKSNTGVLHYDGTEWSREPICLYTPAVCAEKQEKEEEGKGTTLTPAGFTVLAIEAAGPGQAWMLARQTGQHEGIVLLRREGTVWRKRQLLGPLGLIFAKTNPTVSGVKGLRIEARAAGQPLTVTSQGVWVDATITIGESQSDATIYYDIASEEVSGSWCDLDPTVPEAARQEICRFPLGSELPAGEGRSFAWAGNGGPGEEFGTRTITGVGQGAMLIFEHEAFARIPLSGNGGTSAGAALSAPDQGWLGPSYRLTRAPVPSGLASWPVPFRRPLLAIASQPGASVGSLSSEALAVGAAGEVARYLPGVGWQPESLLTGSGARATPTLRAVAWPTPNFAYAVGDEGAMWLWRESTGLWEADPGAPPNLIRGNFTGIAFDPDQPERGYAVGKQGLLLGYGKRWTQEGLPEGISPEANITSIAFAGDEALATWTLAVPARVGLEPEYIGGVIVNDGTCRQSEVEVEKSCWRVDEGATTALSELEGSGSFAPRRIAALPDGGAVVVSYNGGVIEREAAGAPWHAVPGPLLGYPSAVAAVREGGQVRALVSVGETGAASTEPNTDRAQAIGQPPAGQAPLLTEPYPLPASGLLIRQTATGWQDEERDAFPQPPAASNQISTNYQADGPREPDPLLAILVDPTGTEGWAVGGQTGEIASKEFGDYVGEGLQTAAAMRYGPTAAPPGNAASVPISTLPGEATFAIGGGAACEGACADLVNTGIGPVVWLGAAVGRAASIPGVRAFLYTGGGVSTNLDLTKVSSRAFAREEFAYADRLASGAGAMPVFAAPSQSDRYQSSLSTFESAFSYFAAPFGQGAATGVGQGEVEQSEGGYSYGFDSTDETGSNPVRVVVLGSSSVPVNGQTLCWLEGQLARAKAEMAPAIVVGNEDAQGELELTQLLVTGVGPRCIPPGTSPGAASAYFFEANGNTQSLLSWGSATIPDYGSGSLGYIKTPETLRHTSVPASGFLLASVNVAARSATTDVAPVSVRLIPSIASLSINALDGTFLRRSQTALFEALARRPIGGDSCTSNGGGVCRPTSPDPYVQIPARCVNGYGYEGRPCGVEIEPEYRFSSSRPDIANFVEVDPNSPNPRTVYLDSSGKPVADPTSGLLCAFNSGTTVVSVETGGLSYAVPVTVQQGSVQRPCGTVPRTDLTAPTPPVEPPPPPVEGEPPFEKTPGSILPPAPPANPTVSNPASPVPVQPSVPVAHHVPPKPPVPLQLPFFAPTPLIAPLPVIVPPAPPAAAEPAPPTGTSPVTQPAVSPEPEEEEEAAFDLVHHAVAYLPGRRPGPTLQAASRSGGHGVSNLILPGLLIIAAVALGGTAGPRLRRSPEPAFHRNRSQRRPFDGYP